MKQNFLYLLVGGLLVGGAVVGYQVYQDKKQATGVDISVSERGIGIEKK